MRQKTPLALEAAVLIGLKESVTFACSGGTLQEFCLKANGFSAAEIQKRFFAMSSVSMMQNDSEKSFNICGVFLPFHV